MSMKVANCVCAVSGYRATIQILTGRVSSYIELHPADTAGMTAMSVKCSMTRVEDAFKALVTSNMSRKVHGDCCLNPSRTETKMFAESACAGDTCLSVLKAIVAAVYIELRLTAWTSDILDINFYGCSFLVTAEITYTTLKSAANLS